MHIISTLYKTDWRQWWMGPYLDKDCLICISFFLFFNLNSQVTSLKKTDSSFSSSHQFVNSSSASTGVSNTLLTSSLGSYLTYACVFLMQLLQRCEFVCATAMMHLKTWFLTVALSPVPWRSLWVKIVVYMSSLLVIIIVCFCSLSNWGSLC